MFVTVKELKDILFYMDEDANDKIVKVEFTNYEKDNIGFISNLLDIKSNVIQHKTSLLNNDIIIYDGSPVRLVSEIIKQFNITDQDEEIDKLFMSFNRDYDDENSIIDIMEFYKSYNLNKLDLIKKFESSIVGRVTKNLISGKYCIYINQSVCSNDQ